MAKKMQVDIRRWRTKRGMTQLDFIDVCMRYRSVSVHQEQISRWEHGKRMSATTVAMLRGAMADWDDKHPDLSRATA